MEFDTPTEEAPHVYLDGEAHRAPGGELTGAQILSLAGHDPAARALFAEGHRGLRIGAEEVVRVQEGSRFVTRPLAGAASAHPSPHPDDAGRRA